MKKQRILYFIGCNDYAIKIGFTEDLHKRMKQLQTGNPYELKLLHIIEDINPELERFIHVFFQEVHITQEWYKYEQACNIIDLLKNNDWSMLDVIKMVDPMLYQAYRHKKETGKTPWWYTKINNQTEAEQYDYVNQVETPEQYITRTLDKWNKEHVSVF